MMVHPTLAWLRDHNNDPNNWSREELVDAVLASHAEVERLREEATRFNAASGAAKDDRQGVPPRTGVAGGGTGADDSRDDADTLALSVDHLSAAPAHDVEGRDDLRTEVERLREVRDKAEARVDALEAHIDRAGGGEANLVALLDLYFEQRCKAERERDEARAEVEKMQPYYDAVRSAHNGYDPSARRAMAPYLQEPATPRDAIRELVEEAERGRPPAPYVPTHNAALDAAKETT